MKSKNIKRCIDCGRFLSESDFHRYGPENKYIKSHCKKCASNRMYIWRLENKNNEDYKKYCRDYTKQWYINNAEHKKSYDKLYYEENSEYKKEYQKFKRAENPDYKKRWAKRNKKHVRYYDNQWRRSNLNKVYTTNARRRVNKINQTPKLTIMETKKIQLLYGISNILGKNFVVDHIKPISKGGSHHPNNLQILTKTLNTEKAAKWPLTKEEKLRYNGFKI